MTNAKESTMRRVAIVLASLPQPVAQRLLGTLQNDSQQLVRAALGSLADVDPLERRRALDGFAKSLKSDFAKNGAGRTTSSDAAEIVFSKAAIRNLNDRDTSSDSLSGSGARNDTTPARFAFLQDVDDESLVAHLRAERPQTLAIILASISPSQAARVLPRLDVKVRAEAMRRMANLTEIPDELIDDIGNQLRTRLSPTIRIGSNASNGAGRRALDAILAELPSEPSVSEVQGATRPAGHASLQSTESPERDFSLAQQGVNQAGLRIAPGTSHEARDTSSSIASMASNQDGMDSNSPLRSAESIHRFLVAQHPEELRDTLAQVPIRQAMLALCGLPKSTAERVLSSLPRKQAKQVREQLASLGSLELREIDDAKRTVVAAALANSSGKTTSVKRVSTETRAAANELKPMMAAA